MTGPKTPGFNLQTGRKWGFKLSRTEPLPSKHPSSTRKKASMFFRKSFTKSTSKKTVSLHRAANSDQPNPESFRQPRLSKEHTHPHLSTVSTNPNLTPVSTTIQHKNLAMSPTRNVRETPLDITSIDNGLVHDDESLPSVSKLDARNVASHASTSKDSSAAIENPMIEQAYVSQMDVEEDADIHPETSGSGTMPSQMLDFPDSLSYLSDDLSDKLGYSTRPTITKSFSQVMESLREMYGPGYQQTDDIAGLGSSQGTEPILGYLSPDKMLIDLKSISASRVDETSSILRESIAPWLSLPSLYSELIQKATSSVDEQTDLDRFYVSSWIFMSLAMSRIDGLRFMFTIHLSLQILHIDVTSFPVAKAAMLAELKWFRDASTVDVERNMSSLGYRTGSDPTSLPKVAAVASGQNQPSNRHLVPERANTPEKSAIMELPEQIDDHISAGQSVEESAEDDETELPPSRMGTQPKPQQGIGLDSQKEFTGLGEADPSEIESNVLPENGHSQVPLLNSRSKTDIAQARSHTPSSGKKSSRNSTSDQDLVPRTEPTCSWSSISDSELKINVDPRHQDTGRSSQAIHPFALLSTRLGLHSVPDVSDFSTERSRVDKPSIDERPLTLGLIERQKSPYNDGFSVRSGKEAEEFFVRGRVFAIIWHENVNPLFSDELHTRNSSYPTLRLGGHEEMVDSHIRRFVIARARRGHCLALPIRTFDEKDSSMRNVLKAERRRYTIIYDNNESSRRSLHTSLFTKGSIPVETEASEAWLPRSRIDFEEPQTIGWKIKVRSIGMVKGEQNLLNLMQYLITELQRDEEEESIPEDDESEQQASVSHRRNPSIASSERPSTPWT